MSELRPINLVYMTILIAFYEAGGSGELDIHNRVKAGGQPLQGDSGAWMVLVARGYVAGERGKILLTQEGRDVAAEELASRQEVLPEASGEVV